MPFSSIVPKIFPFIGRTLAGHPGVRQLVHTSIPIYHRLNASPNLIESLTNLLPDTAAKNTTTMIGGVRRCNGRPSSLLSRKLDSLTGLSVPMIPDTRGLES